MFFQSNIRDEESADTVLPASIALMSMSRLGEMAKQIVWVLAT